MCTHIPTHTRQNFNFLANVQSILLNLKKTDKEINIFQILCVLFPLDIHLSTNRSIYLFFGCHSNRAVIMIPGENVPNLKIKIQHKSSSLGGKVNYLILRNSLLFKCILQSTRLIILSQCKYSNMFQCTNIIPLN